MIYYLRSGDYGPIKIGFSQDPDERLLELQTGSPEPLRLLMTMPGSLQKEAELHCRFAKCHLRGEWFYPSVELLRHIEELGGHVDPIAGDVPVNGARLFVGGPDGIIWTQPMEETK